MEIELEKATNEDAKSIFDIQVRAFKPLLENYQDYDTSPANESIDRVRLRINRENGAFYKILVDGSLAGAICIYWKENDQFWISPMFIDPSFHGKGIAQSVLQLVEERFPQARTWELHTLLEEKRNCHLYEKMGYKNMGINKILNERATLINYKKVMSKIY